MLNDVTWETGKQNMGGLKDSIYVTEADNIDLTTPLVIDSDGKTITGDIVLKSATKFKKMYFTKGTGKLDFNVVGERDGKSFENMAEYNVPGAEPANLATVDSMLNGAFVAIVKDGTNFYVLGLSKDEEGNVTIDFPVYTESVTGSTGAAAADKRGMTIVLKSEAPHSPLIYTGDIDLDDAA